MRDVIARLPISIRVFYTNPPERRYVVTDLNPELFSNPNFKIGVEIVAFDGIPIDQVVQELGRTGYGANPAARSHTAERLLWFRVIATEAIPENEAVLVSFMTATGTVEQVVASWSFFMINNPALLNLLTKQTIDWTLGRDAITAHYKLFQAPTLRFPDLDFTTLRIPAADRKQIEVAPAIRQLVSAELIPTTSGTIGRLRLFSFEILPSPPLIEELSRVIKMMPSNGLVIDIRENPGGFSAYAKALTELFSDIPIPALPVVARVSELQQLLTQSTTVTTELLFGSLRSAVRTGLIAGEEFTGPVGNIFATSLESLENPVPRSARVYFGPVITLVDAGTYSAGDLFAALQVDQGHSLVVGVSDNTGAGGASTLSYRDFARLFPTIFDPLPQGVDFATSFRRFYRTGKQSGTMIEAFGIKPEIRYYPTRDDVLSNECDMFDFLGEKLASMGSATTADA